MHSVELYKENANGMMMEQFVLDNHPLVKKISLYIKRRLPSHISLEDLMQSGFVGLLEARNSYKEDMGTTFETFASIRIRGAIIDSLRKNSWGTRESSKNRRKMANAVTSIEQRGQKQATTEEIAAEMGVTLDEHAEMCQQISVSNVVSLDLLDSENEVFGDEAANPLAIAQVDDIKGRIKSILTDLPEREQLVLSLYYLEEFTFKQVGEILNLTEARICQLHSQAIARVQSKIRANKL
ncbi:MAG: FliA/WhiG family RNA polymerase sigma factor [Gammaproteobacteria bacterium]|nr:FliA/WhiG family RNA polymerase sigma factor [Gammaproteobacteria bacterium]